MPTDKNTLTVKLLSCSYVAFCIRINSSIEQNSLIKLLIKPRRKNYSAHRPQKYVKFTGFILLCETVKISFLCTEKNNGAATN